jgi:hypothetical protein
MQLVSTTEFLAWATSHGIGRSPEYPHSETLWFSGAEATWYRYRPTSPAGHDLQLLERVVEVAAAGSPLWAFPLKRGGSWIAPRIEPWDALVRAEVEYARIPVGYVGAIQLAPEEAHLATRLLAAAVETQSLWPLTLIPEHARCLLLADEGGDFLGAFPDDGARVGFTHALVSAGYQEPVEPDPRVSLTDPWLDLQ